MAPTSLVLCSPQHRLQCPLLLPDARALRRRDPPSRHRGGVGFVEDKARLAELLCFNGVVSLAVTPRAARDHAALFSGGRLEHLAISK